MLVDKPLAEAPGEPKDFWPPRRQHTHADEHNNDDEDELERELKDAPQQVANRAGEDGGQKRQRHRRELLENVHGVTRIRRTVGVVDCSIVGAPR